MRNLAAIDFETANECRCSVCSVGVVIVRDGEIVDRFYSLIHPEPEYFQWFCQQVHGLGPEDTEDAPVFPKVWEKIEPLIEGLPLVAHNSPLRFRRQERTGLHTTNVRACTTSAMVQILYVPGYVARTELTRTSYPDPRVTGAQIIMKTHSSSHCHLPETMCWHSRELVTTG